MTKGWGTDVDPAHGKTSSGHSVREGLWDGETKSSKSKHSCLGFVEGKIVALESVAEVVKSGRDAVAVGWWGNKTKVIDDGGPDEVRVLEAMQLENTGQRAYEEEGAEGVALCHPLMQCVCDDIAHVEGGRRISSKMDTGGNVVKETKP